MGPGLPAALLGSTAGVGLASLGAFLAQVSGGDPNPVATYVSAGGSVTAVGGLLYIAKMMVDGRLIARDTAVEAAALKKLAEVGQELAQSSLDREREYQRLVRERRTKA